MSARTLPPPPGSAPLRALPAARRFAGRGAFLLLLVLVLFTGTTATSQASAQSVLPALKYGTYARLPLSVVGAGVAGTAGVVTAPAWGTALAGAAITAGALWAGEKAISWAWKWATSTPATFGDPPTSTPEKVTRRIVNGTSVSVDHTFWVLTANNLSTTGSVTYAVEYRWVTLTDSYRQGTYVKCPSGTYLYGAISAPGDMTNGVHSSTFSGSCGVGVRPVSYGMYKSWAAASATNAYGDAGMVAFPGDPAPSTGAPGTTPLEVRPRQQCSGSSAWITGVVQSVTRAGSTSDVPIDLPECPAGTTRTVVETPIVRPADGATVGSVANPWSPPAVPAAYPDCSTYACVMTLVKTTPDGQKVDCGTAPEACASYAEVVKRYPDTGTSAATVPRTAGDGASYQCMFGPYPVAVAECQVIPRVGVEPAPTTENGGRNCVTDFSWNPVSWVLEPVKCALTWAGKPRDGVLQGQVAGVRDAWNGSGPGQYLAAFGNLIGQVGAIGDRASGCDGPAVTFDTGLLKGTYRPLYACPGSMAEHAAKVVRVLGIVGLYLGAASVAVRVVASSLGLQLNGFGRTEDV